MEYRFTEDLKCIRELLSLTQAELAEQVGVELVTVSRHEQELFKPSAAVMEKTYAFAFEKNIRINRLKEMLWREDLSPEHKLLFHGAKGEITGELSVKAGRSNNDFGQGFYAGESYEQAVSFVSGFEKSSVYYLDFDVSGLKSKEYHVDRDWMMTIAYFRGTLDAYRDHPTVQKLAADAGNADYIIAPIADNRMFQIINSFIAGEITDAQCEHCLSAINLGMQYVFLTEKAVKKVQPVERVYIAQNERKYYADVRSSESRLGEDKVKLARIKYRGQGKYIDEILTVAEEGR